MDNVFTGLLRRIGTALVVLGAAFEATPGYSQTYPTKPIRTVLSVAGGADVIARMVAQRLTEVLGQPVIVDIQAGAGGAIGIDMVARAEPDGHTILLTTVGGILMHGLLAKNSPYHPFKSFTPITKVTDTVFLVIANPSRPFNSVKELVDYARRNPGKVNYGTSGIGTAHHLSAELIQQLTGINWVHVPYKSGPPVVTAILSDQVEVGFSIFATVAPILNSGKLKILGVNNSERYHLIPDVPTVAEQIPGYDTPKGGMSYLGPANMPRPIVTRLNREIVKIMNMPDVRAKAESIGFVSRTSTPEELTAIMKQDLAILEKITKAAGIEPQ